MNDTRSALFSARFHDLLRQAAFVVRTDAKTFTEKPNSSADGPTQKGLLTRHDAPPHHLLVIRGVANWPDVRRARSIQFP